MPLKLLAACRLTRKRKSFVGFARGQVKRLITKAKDDQHGPELAALQSHGFFSNVQLRTVLPSHSQILAVWPKVRGHFAKW